MAASTASDGVLTSPTPGDLASNWGKTLVSVAAPGENVIGPAFAYGVTGGKAQYQDTYGL